MGHIAVGVLVDSWSPSRSAMRPPLAQGPVPSLGPHLWNTADLKECHPEYPGPYLEGRVDYALFGVPDVKAIGNISVPPDLIVESKPLRTSLGPAFSQLKFYAEAEPGVRKGVVVLTNGDQWWIYDISKGDGFAEKLVDQVYILTGSRRASAQILNQWLGRAAFG